MNLLEVEKYQDTFGPKSKRKKPKLESTNLEELNKEADHEFDSYNIEKDTNRNKHEHPEIVEAAKDKRLLAG